MNFISAENISKSFGIKVLFEDLSLGISQGQKVALIGLNGSGKSTLLKVLAGIEAPDSGKVSVRKGIHVVYLPQEPDLDLRLTVSEIVFDDEHPAKELIREYEQLLSISSPTSPQQTRLEQLISEIDAQNAWDYEVRIKQILSRLDIHFLDTPVAQLSGGQRKRVALAQALIGEPELLILDEPTNHLDLESIEWLEKFLATQKQSLLLVTHDRYFLDSITNEIVELDQGKLFPYKGNYAYYLMKKAERKEQETSTREKAQGLFKRELDWLRRSPKARTTKSKSRIDAAHDLKEKAKNVYEQEMRLQIKGRRIGGKVLEIKKIRKAYDDKLLLDDFTYTFNKRDRIGIVGPNGVGKTTFIKMMTGEVIPDSGKVRKGDTIYFGHYEQSGLKFKPNQRVIDVVREVAENVELSKSESVSATHLLEYFLFPRSMHHSLVETLSGGEKRRLHLLRILMTNPNFLILDEPTNDLDLITLRKLEEFLVEYDGCLVVVSHDRYFMDRLIDHLFVFEGNGKIRDFPGSYSQYRSWLDQQKSAPSPEKKSSIVPETAAPKPTTEKKKLSYKEQREYEALEGEIETLETRKVKLDELLNSGETDFQKLQEWSQELETLSQQLEDKSDRWLELAEWID